MNWHRLHTTASIAMLRILLFCVNVIFIISGVVLILLGIVLRSHFKDFIQITSEMNSSSPYILMGLGVIIFFIGLFAFWCTIKGHVTMLYIYSITILLILILEIAVAVTVLMKRRTYEETFKTTIREIMKQYPRLPINSPIDRLQKTLSCCGVDSYADWFQTLYGRALRQVPESCCKRSLNHTCVRMHLKEKIPDDINTDGCYEAVILTIKNNYPIFGGIIIGIGLFPLLGIILSCCLARQMNKYRYEELE